MNVNDATLEVLLRYLDGTVPPADRVRIEALLRQDRMTREMLRDIAQQAVVIADVERVQRGRLAETASAVPRDVSASYPAWQRTLLAVASLVLVIVVIRQFLQSEGNEPAILTINSVNGPVEWVGSGGRRTETLAVGKQLPGGTLELLSAESWVDFEFLDGSTVTLSGHSMVIVSGQPQKEIQLRHGSLSAKVAPQPAGQPMLVHTPAAHLEVLGTQFNVETQPQSTTLTVNEGRVLLKRVTDGKEVHVPARHQIVASIAEQNGFAVNPRGAGVSGWRSELRSDVVHGQWISDQWLLGQKLKQAVKAGEMSKEAATAAYKKAATLEDERGSVWAMPSSLGTLVVLSVPPEPPVVFEPGAKFRIRGRLHSPEDVVIGITTNTLGGGFAGKFSVTIAAEDLRSGEDEFEIEVPLSQFRPLAPQYSDLTTRQELSDWWCFTKSTTAKFQITSVELIGSP